MQQGGFSAARAAQERHVFARLDGETDLFERFLLGAAVAVREPLDANMRPGRR